MKAVDDKSAWSVICFVVPAEYRGQGVARALLAGAVAYAKEQGATLIEAYPVDKPARSNDDTMWFGAKSMYDKAGFREVARRKPHRPIVRKSIGVNNMAGRTPGKSGKLARKPAVRKVARAKRRKSAPEPLSGKATEPVLLSGGNPQIAKGYGDAPVKAYIAAMPGWKSDLGRRLDALIERAVPGVKKAVKWNSPFYGVENGVWFLSFHCFTKYVKVTFFRGAALSPVPPGASKHKDVRYLDIYEGRFDEAQVVDWVKQASQLPGEKL
jgi:hypothetical protein